MSFQPTEEQLKRLGFTTTSPAQPFPTRTYGRQIADSPNYLALTPRPGMQGACEYNAKGQLVAKHLIGNLSDIEESVAGRGRRFGV